MTNHPDLIVLGAGSGGLSCAQAAAKSGATVTLVERGQIGGTCVNRGCVPKKLLWTAAEAIHRAGTLAGSGVLTGRPKVDLARLRELSDRHIAGIRDGYATELAAQGIRLIRGEARIVAPRAVAVSGERIEAADVVVATGGRPARPDLPGADLAEVSDDALGWTRVPERLLIVGAGYIGCEFAAIFAALGSEVTLVSDTGSVLTEFAPELRDVAAANLAKQGVALRLGTRPVRFDRQEPGLRAAFDSGPEGHWDRILLATGRDANLGVLGEMAERIETRNGHVATQALETALPHHWALGDCADRLPLTPVAVADGRTAARRIAGGTEQPVDLSNVATAAFLLPPVAQVGQPEGFATSNCFDPLQAALQQPAPQAFWGLCMTKGDLTSVGLVGDGVGETIGWAAQLVRLGARPQEFPAAPAVHPSSSEEPLG